MENAQENQGMTEQEVIDLMETSKSEQEWNDNCDEVKRRCNGYPSFWYGTMIMSGRLTRIKLKNGWGF